jgi:RND family efflux transporter MFP subunit
MTVLSALLFLAACSKEPAPAAASAPAAVAPAAVRTAPVEAVQYRPVVELTGTMSAVASVQLGFDVPGRIEKLLVDRGERVKKGRPIARLDDSMAQAQVAQAQAAVSGARAQVAAGEATLGRLEKLKAAGGVSEQQWSDATAGVAAGRAGVEQAEAALRLAQTHLENHVLRSPISGIVSNGPDNAGMMVGAGTPIFLVEDLSALQVKATAPESASWLAEGQEAEILVPGGEPVQARVSRVIPSLDMATRRIPVEVRVDDPPPSLRANGFARVSVRGAADIPAFQVPAAAVVARPDFCVFVQEGEVLKRVPVEVLERSNDSVIVRASLAVDAQVVLDPTTAAGAE